MRTLGYLLVISTTLIAQTCLANEWLLGEYSGKVTESNGFDAKPEDACKVFVTRSDRYGGSLQFEIQGADKIAMETRNVDAALQAEGETVKLFSPAQSGRPGEWVILRRGEHTRLLSLKLKFIWANRHQEKSVACGYLIKQ